MCLSQYIQIIRQIVGQTDSRAGKVITSNLILTPFHSKLLHSCCTNEKDLKIKLMLLSINMSESSKLGQHPAV